MEGSEVPERGHIGNILLRLLCTHFPKLRTCVRNIVFLLSGGPEQESGIVTVLLSLLFSKWRAEPERQRA